MTTVRETGEFEVTEADVDRIGEAYLALWSESDPGRRRETIEALWARDGEELVEGVRFHGHDELERRIVEAYQQFVASGRFSVTRADDLAGHHDVVTFTIQLTTPAGDVAWASRVVLLLDAAGLIRRDYHVTVLSLVD